MTTNESEPHMLSFPRALPQHFLEQLGYRGVRQFVAVYGGNHVTWTDGVRSSSGSGDEDFWTLLRPLAIMDWLERHAIDFGSSIGPPRHWLVVDRHLPTGLVVPVALASRVAG